VLPCGNTACLECIEKSIENSGDGKFKCNFQKCSETHSIYDIKSLKTNVLIENAVKDNLETLTKNVFKKLKESYEKAKGIAHKHFLLSVNSK
jgi:hypothetical protein